MKYLKEIRVYRSKEPNNTTSNPMPESITEIMKPREGEDGDKGYIRRYSFHFNRSLAEYAVSQLKFVDPSAKPFKWDRVIELIREVELKLPEEATQGDLHYIINKIRAEHSLDTVKSDIRALKLALECLESPNVIEGEVFLQWAEHMYRVKKDILWDKFMD